MVLSVTKRAVIYVRQSFDKSGNQAGVDRQENASRGLCAAREWGVVAVVVENNVSASEGKREGWERVLRMIEQGEVDVVVAWHLDRITRTMRDLETLIELGVKHDVGIATATGDIDLTTDTGRMVARILAAVARAEVERKAERQILANLQRVESGRHFWAWRPFGYEPDGTPREKEAELLRDAYAQVVSGVRVARIRDYWNSLGMKTSKGKEWSTQTVGQLLKDPRNAGILTYNGVEAAKGAWTPLIDEDTLRVAQRRLRGTGTRRGPLGRSDAELLGVATCGTCKKRVYTQTGPKGPVYTCERGCFWLPMEWVNGQVFLKLSEVLSDPERREQWEHLAAGRSEQAAALQAEHMLLVQRLDQMAADYADGLLTREQTINGTARVRLRLAEVETELAKTGVGPEGLTWDVEWFADVMAEKGPDERRETLRRLTSKIVLHSRNRKHGLWPELVEVVPA